jgi:Ni,Fe-hydrogenase III large subunit
VDQALSKLAKTPLPPLKFFTTSKEGEATQTVEAPRGENLHYLVAGKNTPKFIRVRAPTFANLSAIPTMMKGLTLSDVPVVISSIDPCFACTDRISVVNIHDKTIREVEL